MGQRVFDKAEYYVRRGNRKRVRALLKKHPYLRQSHDSLLVFNAIWRNRSMLPYLMQRGVHPDCRMGGSGNTPLMQAAADGDMETIEILLKHGADPNARNEENELPLGFACSWEQWDAAKALIQKGADVNGVEDEGRTHLDWVVLSNKPDGIAVLRSSGALPYSELARRNGM